jgi:hypothetical protein
MKRVCAIVAVLMVFSSLMVGAVNLQHVIALDSPLYSMVRMLYLETGSAVPSTSGPWSTAELLHLLDRLPKDKLTAEGKQLFQQVLELAELRDTQKQSFQGSIGFEPTLELYLHSNPTDYRLDTDWVYDYDARKPLIGIPVEMYMTDYIYSKADFAILRTRNSLNNTTSVTDSSEIFAPAFSFNNPFSEAIVNHLDLNFPERAVIGIGTGRMNLTIGRDDLSWGPGKTGSLTVGDHLDYYDFIRFTSFHDKFKYTYLVAGFDSPSWISSDQNSTVDDNDTATTDDDNIKMYIAHRFEFRMFSDRVSLALTEAMMYQSSTLDFRYLNPAMFFHDMFIRGNSNSTLTFELNVNPYKNLNVYANFLLDEFPYPGEDQTASWSHPNGIGQQYGIEGAYPMGDGYLSGWFEYVKTDPYLYLRDQVDYIVNRRIFNMESGFSVDRNFLGYEYGNDALVIAGGAAYRIPDLMAASLSATYMLHGESSMATAWGTGPAAVGKKTPYDDPATVDKTIEKSLKVSGRFESNPFAASSSKHLRNLGLMTQLDYIMHWNKGNLTGVDTNDIQWTFGIDWKL